MAANGEGKYILGGTILFLLVLAATSNVGLGAPKTPAPKPKPPPPPATSTALVLEVRGTSYRADGELVSLERACGLAIEASADERIVKLVPTNGTQQAVDNLKQCLSEAGVDYEEWEKII